MPEAAADPAVDFARLLFVRLSAVGDVVHALFAFQALREARPAATLGWLVEDRNAALLEGYPGLDRLHQVPRRKWREAGTNLFGRLGGLRALRRELVAEGYAAALDLQGLSKSGLAAWLSGAPVRVGYGDADARELNRCFTNRRIVPPPALLHVAERNAALLAAVGVPDGPARVRAIAARPAGLPLPVREEERRRIADFLAAAVAEGARPLAVLHVGAGWPTKVWPAAHQGELVRLLVRDGWRVVAAWGSPGECALAEELARTAGGLAAPPTNLRELGELCRRAGLVVGGDTGPVHLAAALGVPTLGLYGPSDPARNGPYGPRTATVRVDCPLAPCWKTRCPEGRSCLESLAPAEVLAAALALASPVGERRPESEAFHARA